LEALNVKEEARRLIEKLPDDATWDDVMHEIFVRQAIEAGMADGEAGRLTSVEDVRSKLGLSQP
jgi:predicted transcriptional regulator